ncbi:RNA polymerase sigma factor [Planobispora siamensis]|uniref:RNA polymerase sigma factor, sigma-70 family n=1 Tax=Planobispora siamensis TaxID=936338 RepID=A0A8J3WRR5_9ACTN|nr:sigma-70 family RNA polymerase sigma factor [Planobispora siamensis]GIH97141.1 hypothetical protein Psi01_77710 [Planobispora siamensis]
MPGWPTVGRADDQRLVEALRHADTQAPASLYDAYAERLTDYAGSLLADRDGAAEAVHDALVTAQGCVDRLRDAGRLRPWLYALVRFRCTIRPQGEEGTTPLPSPEGHDDPQERELAWLVYETLAELSGPEREILELSLRHGLGAGEVGAVVGLTSRQVTTRLGRARDHVENAAAAVVLARVGRAHCPDLSAMVDSLEGPLPPMLRRRLSGHIARCEVCIERRDRHVSAGRLLDLVPVLFPPLSLRRRVIETCVNPALDATRAAIVEAGDRFDRSGFPVVTARPARESGPRRTARRRRSKRSVPIVVAAVGLLAATGGMIALTGQDIGSGSTGLAEAAPEPAPPTITFEPGPETTSPQEATPEDTPEPEPTPEPVSSVTPSAAPAPGPVRRTAPQRSRPARTSAPRPAARLAVSCPSHIGQEGGQIRVTAHNAPLAWSAAASGGLTVQPRRGRLKAGATGVIWVTYSDIGNQSSGRVSFRSAGGDPSCTIMWESPEPTASEPDPDPVPTPSESLSPESTPAPETS